VKIRVNGEPMELANGATVADLLAVRQVDTARVAVEKNQDVVPRAGWSAARLTDGDEVEIVSFVGGG
jgi:thiamine biosynthesis protein ThiS